MSADTALANFSSTYLQARENFLAAAEAAGAELDSFVKPVKGAEGEDLFTDVALLGPESARTVLTICSGTHGVEGFCGSAIQTGLLRDGIAGRLPADVRVVMIHALNPYGFSHFRRFNEDNVDLNRNFIDHRQPHAKNPAYDALYGAINPRADSRLQRDVAFLRLLLQRTLKGKRKLKVAITQGQHTHPAGLFFGGTCETWSNQTLRRICERYFKELPSPSPSIYAVLSVVMANGLTPVSACAASTTANEPANAIPTANAIGFNTCFLDISISYLWSILKVPGFNERHPR